MNKRLALTKDGQLTYCTADDEHVGKGSCNYIEHQMNGESNDDFMKRVNESKQWKNYDEFNSLLHEDDWKTRYTMAERGPLDGINDLVNDENERVRSAVAERCVGLGQLVYDQSWCVRIEVAKRVYGLDKLVDDPDEDVRIAVVEQGYGLNQLANDGSENVRMAVNMYKLERHVG
jgi:hypothetical protein